MFLIVASKLIFVLFMFQSNSSEAVEYGSVTNKSSDEVYDFILKTQYLHELCKFISPENTQKYDDLYAKSGISIFEQLMPKKYNSYIKLIDSPDKKVTFKKMLAGTELDDLKIECESRLPHYFSEIEQHTDELYKKAEALFLQFQKKKS